MTLLTAHQSHAKLLASGKSEEIWFQLDVNAPERKKDKKRAPVDVVLVIDCSGSMGACSQPHSYEEEIIDDYDLPFRPYHPNPYPYPMTPPPYVGPFWNQSGSGQTAGGQIGGWCPPLRPLPQPRRRRRTVWHRQLAPVAPTPLDNALAAAREVLARLTPADRAAVVLYDNTVAVAHPLCSDHERAISNLHYVCMGGSTALADALYTGIGLLENDPSEERAKMVFLLSDGQANVGETNPDRIASRAAKAAARGIRISTFGLGSSFNEKLMESVAQAGAGTYRYLESADAAIDAFSGELADLFAITANDVSIDVKALPGVRIERILGLDAETPRIRVGDIPANARRTLLVCCEVETGRKSGEMELVEVIVKWRSPEAKRAKSEKKTLFVGLTRSEKQVSTGIDADVLAAVAAFQASEAQAEAAAHAEAGRFAQADSVLNAAFVNSSSMLSMAPDSAMLIGKMSELESNRSALENYDEATAKSMRYQSYRTRNSR